MLLTPSELIDSTSFTDLLVESQILPGKFDVSCLRGHPRSAP